MTWKGLFISGSVLGEQGIVQENVVSPSSHHRLDSRSLPYDNVVRALHAGRQGGTQHFECELLNVFTTFTVATKHRLKLSSLPMSRPGTLPIKEAINKIPESYSSHSPQTANFRVTAGSLPYILNAVEIFKALQLKTSLW